jgi:choline dehydrogenase-like flavoprotein
MFLSLLLQLLVIEVCAVLSIESGLYTHLVDADSSEDAEFDYVVVGGGTAGIVIATRLAQKSLKVALVESGGLYESVSVAAIPAADVIPVGSDPNTKASFDWGFVAENVPGANGRSLHYARGKCLGGS